MPTYAAPTYLSATIVEDLNEMQANGNLAALAGGPVTFPVAATAFGQSAPFALVMPANTFPYSMTWLELDGGTSPYPFNIDVIMDDTLGGAQPQAMATPNGIFATTSGTGPGDVPGVYDNGAAGVGATLTVDPGSLPLLYDDGAPVGDGDNVILTVQGDATQNGWYTYTLATGVLTRTPGRDTGAAIFAGLYAVNLHNATGNPIDSYCTVAGVPVIGTDPITFTYPITMTSGNSIPANLFFNTLPALSSYMTGVGVCFYFVTVGVAPGDVPDFGTAVTSASCSFNILTT